jgi:hypothetical protein
MDNSDWEEQCSRDEEPPCTSLQTYNDVGKPCRRCHYGGDPDDEFHCRALFLGLFWTMGIIPLAQPSAGTQLNSALQMGRIANVPATL